MKSLSEVIDAHAARTPDSAAFLEGDDVLTWAGYASRSSRLAGVLAGLGLAPGERVGVLLPDGPGVHVAYVGAEKAGLVTVGIGPRAGEAEVAHLLSKTRASALVSPAAHRDLDLCAIVARLRDHGLRHHVVVEGALDERVPLRLDGSAAPEPDAAERERVVQERRLGPDDVFLLNSTSGTTGLPKCVIHDQRRWRYFHDLAVESSGICEGDVFLSALPAPFGFGIWTAHISPTLLGAPTVLMQSFSADELLRRIERHRVTVLAAVSTQFIMMLNSSQFSERDLSSLRVLFTGGEAVPYERAAEFEERSGAKLLQFYGSNETGALSRTSIADSRDVRLRTAGRVIGDMRVRLFDDAGKDVTASGSGQPGCCGPATSRGYFEDPEANAKLYTPDGWMLTGDIATLDENGVLQVVGRVADFIIRGGKNVSAVQIEDAVSAHPAVALAAAVAMPDPVFGERVCVYAELRGGATLDLERLVAHLGAAGVGKELFPEKLVVLDELPRSSGGKIAKGELREDARSNSEARERT